MEHVGIIPWRRNLRSLKSIFFPKKSIPMWLQEAAERPHHPKGKSLAKKLTFPKNQSDDPLAKYIQKWPTAKSRWWVSEANAQRSKTENVSHIMWLSTANAIEPNFPKKMKGKKTTISVTPCAEWRWGAVILVHVIPCPGFRPNNSQMNGSGPNEGFVFSAHWSALIMNLIVTEVSVLQNDAVTRCMVQQKPEIVITEELPAFFRVLT